MSSRVSFSKISLANLRMESKDERSKSFTETLTVVVSATNFLIASSAFALSLQAKITLAPRLAKSEAVSYPIPVTCPLVCM